MKRNIILITFLSFVIFSCSHKNEFGIRRNNSSLRKIKPNTDNQAYSIIDTTKLYLLVSTRDRTTNLIDQEVAKGIGIEPKYLKFYKNGRVGMFKNINIKNIETFNPKRAESYLYQYENSELIIQIYFKHPECGECFIREKVTKTSNETIELLNNKYVDTYKKIDFPQDYLVFKPDW